MRQKSVGAASGAAKVGVGTGLTGRSEGFVVSATFEASLSGSGDYPWPRAGRWPNMAVW